MAKLMTGITAPGPTSQPSEDLSGDDVVDAYRWILGREPESLEIIGRHQSKAKSRANLRKAILFSTEFARKYRDLRNDDLVLRPTGNFPVLPPDVSRIVFVHVPKTGGTTLHSQLATAIGAGRVAPARHNDLWRLTGVDLSTARLFSGHYDSRCLSFVPGASPRVVTILRAPRERIRSLYHFLRSTKSLAAAANKLELATAAREHNFKEFLEAALEINPAAVDNTYIRTFGGRLPLNRWEQRAEPLAPAALSDLDKDVDALVHRACKFLESMAAVGILEDFDTSLAVVFRALGLPVPDSYQVMQRTADLIENHANFEQVPTEDIGSESDEILSRLTKYDQVIYEFGQALLAARRLKEPTSG
jgi:hypothetical protein